MTNEATDRTPLHGELQVTASLDDLADSDALPVGVDALDRLLDAARHIVTWAEDLRCDVEAWPTMTPAERAEAIASGEGPDTLASDLLGAIDALGVALDGTAAEYAGR